MYDTINLWLSKEIIKGGNLFEVAKNLTNLTEHQNMNNEYYVSGTLGDNYNVNISNNGVSFKGSLAKYYLNDNFHTLTRSDTKRAIEKMADEIHLPIADAKVNRIDFAQNFIMDYKPEAYYNYLGDSQFYNRLTQPNSLYYSNGLRTKLFYNKIAEGSTKKSKLSGYKLPEIWRDKNILRYELRYTSRIAKQFELDKMDCKTLSDEKFYMNLFDKWQSEYKAINKNNLINFDMVNMKTPKDFFEQLILMKLNEIGQNNALLIVEDLRSKNTFEKPEYYSRLKNDIKEKCNKPDITIKSDLMAELDNKINNAKKFYR
ncbi:MAG: hypothetical protein NTW25_11510 [Candidatus Kapabacteria bacterium]|nr:hypothetical protein [Candidatus Kapabacteria bacterium]